MKLLLAAVMTSALVVAGFSASAGPARAEGEISAVDHFKYGSVGIEPEEGLPYWIWQVLPRMFADKLPGPGGYASLGVSWEPGRELPIGFSKKSVFDGSPAVNCAFCHTVTHRTAKEPRGLFPAARLTRPPRRLSPVSSKPPRPIPVSMRPTCSRRLASSPRSRGPSRSRIVSC
jgi:hypothetical protein